MRPPSGEIRGLLRLKGRRFERGDPPVTREPLQGLFLRIVRKIDGGPCRRDVDLRRPVLHGACDALQDRDRRAGHLQPVRWDGTAKSLASCT